jgi:hypothetical protein
LLSQKEFYDWAKDYVLFCHVTTRIPGRKHDGMLRDVGGTGFPTLAILTADGALLARHEGARTVEGVDKTAEAAKAFAAVRAKAAAGDEEAKLAVLVREAELGMVKPDVLAARVKEVKSIPPEIQAKLDGLLFDARVAELATRARTGPEASKAAAAQVIEWAREGKLPSAPRSLSSFVGIVSADARASKDAANARALVEILTAKRGGDKVKFVSEIAGLNGAVKDAERLSRIDALRVKADAGDREAKIERLRLELEGQLLKAAEARRAVAQIPGLTEAELKDLDEAIFEVEITETMISSLSTKRETAEGAYRQVQKWVDAQRFPAKASALRTLWSIPLYYARAHGDSEALEYARERTAELL